MCICMYIGKCQYVFTFTCAVTFAESHTQRCTCARTQITYTYLFTVEIYPYILLKLYGTHWFVNNSKQRYRDFMWPNEIQ